MAGATVCALAAVLVLPPPASADRDLERPVFQTRPPPSFRLAPREVVRIADRDHKVGAERRRHGRLVPTAYTHGPGRWQVSYFDGPVERVQVHVDDRSGAVLEAWSGPQVAWTMARGRKGAFGRHVNAAYVWVPLCLLFLATFFDPRQPFRLLHLDLLVLLAFGASHFFFNRGEISTSVPLAYPVLVYLLVRLLAAGVRPRERRGPLLPLVPARWLAVALVFLVAFRVGLNLADSNVIDVGYAGVIGADRIADGEPLYEGAFPEENAHGDTYGPANYLAYLPFEQALPWSGAWDDVPAAHAAALAFDLLTLGGLIALGRRLRRGPEGRTLGLALGFAWASYPYTLFVLSSNANDSLVALLVTAALLALTIRRRHVAAGAGAGAAIGLGAAAKFAPLALAPLLAAAALARSRRAGAVCVVAVVVVAALAALPFLPDGGPRELYDRTLGYQAGRTSPFSLFGQHQSLGWVQTAVKLAALALAAIAAAVARGKDLVQVAALGAAVLVALQLATGHWFYLYVVWFAPLALVALLGGQRSPQKAGIAPRAEARSRTAGERELVPA